VVHTSLLNLGIYISSPKCGIYSFDFKAVYTTTEKKEYILFEEKEYILFEEKEYIPLK
jgi:predicted nucleic-acid-binding Zn-ribbon protein